MQTTNDRMTEKQVSDLLHLATELQAKAESSNDRDTAVMAYAVQKVCLELTESRLKSKASEQQLASVVAENAGLKRKGREVLNEACKVYEKLNATITSDSGDFIDGQTLHEFQFVLDVETPATDAAIANIQAQGVEMFADMTDKVADEEEFYDNGESFDSLKYTAKQARLFAAQLRQGAAL